MMTAQPFVHLHTHTEYSLLDGMSRLAEITTIAADDGMPALAITDHGNLFGALKFHQATRAAGIRPILGCEAYVAPGSIEDRNRDSENQHLVLLARNRTGFRNLMRLSSIAHHEGYYFKPRLDFELLEKHHEGLIALSACPKGAVPRGILGEGDPIRIAGRYREVFGKDNYFLELMNHEAEDGDPALRQTERAIGEGILDVHRKTGIPLVGTNDSHYAKPGDTEAHDLRLCISTNRPVSDPDRLRFGSDQFYFKTSAMMAEVFRDLPEACSNTLRIAEAIEDYDLLTGESLLPDYTVPGGKTLDAHFEEAVRSGLEERLRSPERHGRRPPASDYRDRLELELGVIRTTGYSAYFLIVQDFVRFARSRRIPVGPGRGSAAGSLVAYCLGITDIDPLAHGLLFERFLNPARISPPDIDVDFCDMRREEVLDYVVKRYGEDRVAQIMTLGTMQSRLVVRDVGRMLEIPLHQVDRLAKLIPDGADLESAIREVPALREAARKPEFAKLFRLAARLEGLPRSVGTHAAGVVIAPAPLEDILPLYKDADPRGPRTETGANATVRRRTQFDMQDCEAVGLFKMDFLGLRSLTHIQDCADRILGDRDLDLTEERRESVEAIAAGKFEKVPPDPEAFDLFARADTDGIFQFESSGMRDLLRSYRPETLDDLAAMNALFRPGPLESGNTEAFVSAKKSGELSTTLHSKVRRLFPETRGLIVYQEQVMLAARELAGYELGQADILRKAMGKKKPEVMEQQKQRFVEGAVARGLPEKAALATFDQIAKFAGYGFNRAHAVGYALVAYVGGWLRTHFPLHFFASLLTSEQRSADRDARLDRFRRRAEACGIRVLPPDVQTSGVGATVEGDAVRYGLGGIKQVGAGAAGAIVEARGKGAFESMSDLVSRIPPGVLNRGALEALASAGALDFVGQPRSRIVSGAAGIVERAQRERGRKDAGVQALFGARPEDTYPECPEWTEMERLNREHGAFGFYWRGHPASEYRRALGAHSDGPLAEQKPDDSRVARLTGLVRRLRIRKTRQQRRMANFSLEDETGLLPVVVFPDSYENCPELSEGFPALVEGQLGAGTRDSGHLELRAETIRSATRAPLQLAQQITLLVRDPEAQRASLEALLKQHAGRTALALEIQDRNAAILLRTASPVAPTRRFVTAAVALLGADAVRLDGEPLPEFCLLSPEEESESAASPAPPEASGLRTGTARPGLLHARAN